MSRCPYGCVGRCQWTLSYTPNHPCLWEPWPPVVIRISNNTDDWEPLSEDEQQWNIDAHTRFVE